MISTFVHLTYLLRVRAASGARVQNIFIHLYHTMTTYYRTISDSIFKMPSSHSMSCGMTLCISFSVDEFAEDRLMLEETASVHPPTHLMTCTVVIPVDVETQGQGNRIQVSLLFDCGFQDIPSPVAR